MNFLREDENIIEEILKNGVSCETLEKMVCLAIKTGSLKILDKVLNRHLVMTHREIRPKFQFLGNSISCLRRLNEAILSSFLHSQIQNIGIIVCVTKNISLNCSNISANTIIRHSSTKNDYLVDTNTFIFPQPTNVCIITLIYCRR